MLVLQLRLVLVTFSNLVTEGLSSLNYTVNINALLLTFEFELFLERITGNATFTADGYLDVRPLRRETFPSGNLTGFNQFAAISATGVHLKGRADLFVNLLGDKVLLRRLIFDTLNFDNAFLNFSQLVIGGQTHDWESISANFKDNFDKDFTQQPTEITERIRIALNYVVTVWHF